MAFSVLRVLNQDRVQPGKGFGNHGHRDMEIVTYVLDGALEHRDSMGNGSVMRHGEVQLMSAGSGVTHSEFNPSDTDELELLQMWVFPATKGTAPRYEQKEFPQDELEGRMRLVVSPDGRDGSLTIGQDAGLHAATLEAGDEILYELPRGRCAWLHLARGSISLDGQALEGGDGAAIRGEARVAFEGRGRAELVLWDLPDHSGAPS